MKLSREQIKTEFIDRQMKHNRKVQDYMILLEKNRDKLPFKIPEWELLRRGLSHDAQKFMPEFVEKYMRIAEYHENKRNNLSNDHIDEATLFQCNKEHSATEPHHIEYYAIHKIRPTNLDICEMCCDWTSHCDRDGEKDNAKYFREVLVKKIKFCEEKKKDFLEILGLLNNFRSY